MLGNIIILLFVLRSRAYVINFKFVRYFINVFIQPYVYLCAQSTFVKFYFVCRYKAKRLLIEKYAICRKEILDPSTTDFEFLQMYVYFACLIACSYYLYCIFRLLLPIELEKARLTFLLSCANRYMIVSRKSQLTFLAEFEYPLERHDVQCLMAAVGEKVVLRRDGQSEELFVSSLSERGLLLKYPVNTDFTSTHNAAVQLGPDDSSFLARPGRLRVSARFYLAKLTFKVLLTSVIDGVTGCGQEWFGRVPVLMCGLPLVSYFCTWHWHAYFAVYFVAASHLFASYKKYTYFTYYRFRMSELTR